MRCSKEFMQKTADFLTYALELKVRFDLWPVYATVTKSPGETIVDKIKEEGLEPEDVTMIITDLDTTANTLRESGYNAKHLLKRATVNGKMNIIEAVTSFELDEKGME